MKDGAAHMVHIHSGIWNGISLLEGAIDFASILATVQHCENCIASYPRSYTVGSNMRCRRGSGQEGVAVGKEQSHDR